LLLQEEKAGPASFTIMLPPLNPVSTARQAVHQTCHLEVVDPSANKQILALQDWVQVPTLRPNTVLLGTRTMPNKPSWRNREEFRMEFPSQPTELLHIPRQNKVTLRRNSGVIG